MGLNNGPDRRGKKIKGKKRKKKERNPAVQQNDMGKGAERERERDTGSSII